MPRRTLEDLFREMEEDERHDRIEATGKASPIEYARMRNIIPQKVYYFIRRGKLELSPCGECGRKVVDVSEADKVLFASVLKEAIQEEEDTAGEGLPG